MQCYFCLRMCAVKRGFYRNRVSNRRPIQRFLCRACGKSFSEKIGTLSYRDRKPALNQPLFTLLCSGVSQRRCADVLNTDQKTVARKLIRFGNHARLQVGGSDAGNISEIVFDEMETFEHTKCKPLSIGVAVEQGSRRILGTRVASMPAKGHLAAIARKRYGFRPDYRAEMLDKLHADIRQKWPSIRTVKSDECPRYPRPVRKHFPNAEHLTYKGRRGCVVGQGELKRGGFDPLFSLNHTCAMLRDNLKRLSRRTWCTTKDPDRLQDLVDLYAHYHNQKILKPELRPTL